MRSMSKECPETSVRSALPTRHYQLDKKGQECQRFRWAAIGVCVNWTSPKKKLYTENPAARRFDPEIFLGLRRILSGNSNVWITSERENVIEYVQANMREMSEELPERRRERESEMSVVKKMVSLSYFGCDTKFVLQTVLQTAICFGKLIKGLSEQGKYSLQHLLAVQILKSKASVVVEKIYKKKVFVFNWYFLFNIFDFFASQLKI